LNGSLLFARPIRRGVLKSTIGLVVCLVGVAGIAHSLPYTLDQTFANPTPDSNDRFGRAAAGVGNNVLIGAYQDDAGADSAGVVYLFDGATGALLHTFLNPAPGNFDYFGWSIAGVDNNVLIGAPFDDAARRRDAGAAYLFDGTTGALLHTFLHPTPARADYFGWSVAAVGDNILIGAYYDDVTVNNEGAAYLFDGETGALLQTFFNPTPARRDFFGYSVAAVGNNVLIGALSDDAGQRDTGAAYLFDGATGALLHTFLNPTPGFDDRFGETVMGVGNNVLIGAPFDDTGADNAGAAYLFDGTTGALLHTFLNPTPADEDYFGSAVGVVGNNVLIGAHGDDTGADNAGAAYLFDAATGALLHTFLHPAPVALDAFGAAVAGAGDNVLIGAPNNDTGAFNAGAAYLFGPAAFQRAESGTIPEPSSLLLFLAGVIGIGLLAAKKQTRKRE
jgi:hypothetical protein